MAPGRNAAQVIFSDLGLDFKIWFQCTAKDAGAHSPRRASCMTWPVRRSLVWAILYTLFDGGRKTLRFVHSAGLGIMRAREFG
jgi:hypothetical protein